MPTLDCLPSSSLPPLDAVLSIAERRKLCRRGGKEVRSEEGEEPQAKPTAKEEDNTVEKGRSSRSKGVRSRANEAELLSIESQRVLEASSSATPTSGDGETVAAAAGTHQASESDRTDETAASASKDHKISDAAAGPSLSIRRVSGRRASQPPEPSAELQAQALDSGGGGKTRKR